MTALWICFCIAGTIFSAMFLLVGYKIDRLRGEIHDLNYKIARADINIWHLENDSKESSK